MAVDFLTISNVLQVPGTYVEHRASGAGTGLAQVPNRVVIIGSMLATGIGSELQLYRMTSERSGAIYFGVNSQLDFMVRKYKRQDRTTEVWAIGMLDDGSAVAATRTITFATNASTAGTWRFLIHGVKVPVGPIAAGATPTQQATALAAAINAAEGLMYTATSALGVVTLTCRHAAAFDNDLDTRHNYYTGESLESPGATTIAYASPVTGTANPDVVDVIAAIGDEWFTTWILGWADSATIAAVESELGTRWGGEIQQDAVAWYGIRASLANTLTALEARNSQFTALIPSNLVPTPPWEWVVQWAAASAKVSNPATPRTKIPLADCLPPDRELRWTNSERQQILVAGGATYTVNGSAVVIERINTTYKTNAEGLVDSTYRNINAMLLLLAIRYTTRAHFGSKFPQAILLEDGSDVDPGVVFVDREIIQAEFLVLGEQWAKSAWIRNFRTTYFDDLVVEIDAENDRVNVVMGPELARQFYVLAVRNDHR